MTGKPSYLGLLNAVAVAERQAHEYLTAWIAVTADAAVCEVLTVIDHREAEHAAAFAKRINELGYQVRWPDNPKAAEQLALVRSDRSDLDKLRQLGLDRLDTGDRPDIFDGFFSDHSIDIATGELLGRYIAEERDTARLFRDCAAALAAVAGDGAAGDGGAGDGAADSRLAALEARVDSLCATVDTLCRIAGDAADAGRTGAPVPA